MNHSQSPKTSAGYVWSKIEADDVCVKDHEGFCGISPAMSNYLWQEALKVRTTMEEELQLLSGWNI